MKTPVLAGIVLIAVGCAAPGLSPTAAAPASSPAASPSPSAPASPPATPGAQPPNALLGVAGGASVAGQLGTYTWLGTGSDAPWLRGTPVTLPAGATATVSFDPLFNGAMTWVVTKTKPGGTDPSTQREIASGSGAVAFTVPGEAGTLLLRVEFANTGDANYFWALSPG